jgi:hypothetical protein
MTGRTPWESWSWIAGTVDRSSSRTGSSGPGSAKPRASRTTFSSSSGTPVSSLSSRNVAVLIPAKRSKADASRYENESAPSRTAAAIPSSGTPEFSRPRTQRARRTSPVENKPPVPGVRIPSSTSRST